MTGLGADIKAGIKGIKGAGDAIRGTALQAADEAFDKNPSDPRTTAAHQKNRDIAESGKQNVRLMDEHMGERERRKKGMPSSAEEARVAGGGSGQQDIPFEQQQGGMRGQHVDRAQVESGKHVPGQEIPGNHLPAMQQPRQAGNVGVNENTPGVVNEGRNF